jgi:hypothetical protein
VRPWLSMRFYALLSASEGSCGRPMVGKSGFWTTRPSSSASW